jgi:hypothetical protein
MTAHRRQATVTAHRRQATMTAHRRQATVTAHPAAGRDMARDPSGIRHGPTYNRKPC